MDIKAKQWVAWEWIVPEYVHDSEIKFTEILVPTVDTVRTTWLLHNMNNVSNHCSSFSGIVPTIIWIRILLFCIKRLMKPCSKPHAVQINVVCNHNIQIR